MGILLATQGAHADVNFPSDTELKSMRDLCAGGDVQAIEGNVSAALATFRRMPGASLSVDAARKGVAAVMEKVNASIPGTALYRDYVTCVQNLVDKYLARQAQQPPPTPAKAERRPAPTAVAHNATPQSIGSGNVNSGPGSGYVFTGPGSPVLHTTTNHFGDGGGGNAAKLRDFDKLVTFRSAILKEEEKFNSIDKEKAMRKDPAEFRKLEQLLLESNQFGRSTLREMAPYLDDDIYTQLQAAQAQLDETHNALAARLTQGEQPHEATTLLLKFTSDSRNFREQLKSLVSEQIRRTR